MKRFLRKGLAASLAVVAGVVLIGCVDPIEVVTDDVAPKLVVDGLITDQYDQNLNKVTLSWTEPFDGDQKLVYNRPVERAQVRVHDTQGSTFDLQEGERGVYYLPEYYAAQAGRSYSVHITLPDGREYESRPELLQAGTPIEEVTYEYKEFTEVVVNASGDQVEKTTAGFQVDATVNDPFESTNYYRWDAEGIFEYYSRAPEVLPIPPSQCWSYVGRVNTKAVAADDKLFNGKNYKQTVAVLPADMPTKYLVKVRQYSLTPQAHEFWRLFNQQQSSVGSIFDPPPAQIRGNLYSKTNPEEQVVGYFGASGVTEKALLINRALYAPLPGVPYVVPFVLPPDDCRSLFPNSTYIRPAGF